MIFNAQKSWVWVFVFALTVIYPEYVCSGLEEFFAEEGFSEKENRLEEKENRLREAKNRLKEIENLVKENEFKINCCKIEQLKIQINCCKADIETFVDDCLELEFVKGSPDAQEKIKSLLSREKIDEYAKIAIEWFKNSLPITKSFLENNHLKAPVGATKNLENELKKIKLRGFLNFLGMGQAKKMTFKIYGDVLSLKTIKLTKDNAPLVIGTIEKFAKNMGVTAPRNVYLCDHDVPYMLNGSTMILGKQYFEGHYDDEFELAIAHELAHSKTGTSMTAFDLLQRLIIDLVCKYPDKDDGPYKYKDKLGFYAMFILSAIERECDTMAVKVTGNPSAQIRLYQNHFAGMEPEPRTGYLSARTHPSTQERVGFGYSMLKQQEDNNGE